MTGASRADGPGFASLTVPNQVDSIRQAAGFVVRTSRAMLPDAVFPPVFEAAIVEALTNAFRHGNTAARRDAGITCEVEIDDRRLTVRVFDQGSGFTLPPPIEHAPPFSADDAAVIPERGFGLTIIRSVFPVLRAVSRPGQFGIEMSRTF